MVFETNIICFGHMKHMKKKPNSQDEYGVGERGGIIVCELLPPLRRSPSLEEGGLGGFAGQGLRPCRRLDIGALRSPL